MREPAHEQGVAVLREGHQQDSPVPTDSPGHPVLGETDQRGVLPVPSAAVVPVKVAALGTGLEPSERISGIGMAMAVGVRPDKDIHPGSGILLLRAGVQDRLGCHTEDKAASVLDVRPGELLVDGLSVECDRPDIKVVVGQVLRDDFEIAAGKMEHGMGYLRGTEDKLLRGRAQGIESHGGKDIPGRSLAAVVLAAQPVRGRMVEFPANRPHDFGCPVRTVREGEEIGDVVAELVAVDIQTHPSGEIHPLPVLGIFRIHVEQGIQFRDESLLPAHCGHEALRILEHVPGILPSVSLGIISFYRAVTQESRIKWSPPVPLGIAATGQTGRRIEEKLPGIGPFAEIGVILLQSQLLCHLGGTPGVVAALERPRNGFIPGPVDGEIATGVEFIPLTFRMRGREGLPNRFIGPVKGDTREPFLVSIHHQRHGVVGDHTPGFLSPKRPNREYTGDLAVLEHTLHHRRGVLWKHHGIDQVGAAEGIPDGHGGIVALGGGMDLVVRTAEPPVGIGKQHRLDAGMVQGGIEDGPFIPASLCLDGAQHLVPCRTRLLPHLVEIPSGKGR